MSDKLDKHGDASYEMNVFNSHAKDRLAITGEEKLKVDLHTEPQQYTGSEFEIEFAVRLMGLKQAYNGCFFPTSPLHLGCETCC
jgi:hypothetical protein